MDFRQALEKKRQAAKKATGRGEKPISEMSEEELASEERRLEAEIRRSRESAVEAGRQDLADARGGRAMLFPRRRKRYWK